jgi:hypothetical protein
MSLSPRAIEQDWGNEIDRNIREHRKFITNKKLEAIFEDGLLLRRMEEANDKYQMRLQHISEELHEIGRWRQAELKDMVSGLYIEVVLWIHTLTYVNKVD